MTVTLMWEARAAEGRGQDLLDWVRGQRLAERPARLELLSAPGDRVLAITWWDVAENARPPELPDPPEELLSRPVHHWRFTSVHTEPAP